MVNEEVYKCKLELVAIAKHCNLKASRPRASRSGLFAVMLYCARVQTAISLLPTKILTSPLDSATPDPISYEIVTIWRSDDVFTL